MALIYIGVGGNQGDRVEYLRMAAQLLKPAVRILRSSDLYETEPWGYKPQPSFYNMVWEAETELDPGSLLRYFKRIEERIGRVKTLRYGPRVIDLDILLYDDLRMDTPELTIPHDKMRERRFVLKPLCDLIPMETDPVSGKTWFDLLAEAPDEEVSRIGGPLDMTKPVIRWGLRSYTMGIVNLTPDSFSGDGLLRRGNRTGAVIDQCAAFIENGADILDLGAESTRPGFTEITADEETARLIPILKEIRRQFPETLLSVDTRRADTVRAALENGIDWINNTGDADDAEMNKVCAASGKVTVLMRSRPLRLNDSEQLTPEKLLERVRSQLLDFASAALRCGMNKNNIVLDPGLGFGSTAYYDLEIARNIREVSRLGYPVLLGASRKSFLGKYLHRPVEERTAGTSAVLTAAILNGCDIIRVHDVKYMKDIAFMADLLRKQS